MTLGFSPSLGTREGGTGLLAGEKQPFPEGSRACLCRGGRHYSNFWNLFALEVIYFLLFHCGLQLAGGREGEVLLIDLVVK